MVDVFCISNTKLGMKVNIYEEWEKSQQSCKFLNVDKCHKYHKIQKDTLMLFLINWLITPL